MVAAGCVPRKPAAKHASKAQAKKPPLPEHIRLSGGEFVLASPSGERLWQGKGKSFDWDTAAQTAALKDAQGTFFRAGKAALKAAAPSVRVDYKSRVVYLEGGVMAQSQADTARFSADRVQWHAKDQKVYGQGNVNFVRGQSQATGDRLVGDTALRRVRLEAVGRPVLLRMVQTRGKPLF